MENNKLRFMSLFQLVKIPVNGSPTSIVFFAFSFNFPILENSQNDDSFGRVFLKVWKIFLRIQIPLLPRNAMKLLPLSFSKVQWIQFSLFEIYTILQHDIF